MSHVEIDDFLCPFCGFIAHADLDTKTGVYTCTRCLNQGRKKKSFKIKVKQ